MLQQRIVCLYSFRIVILVHSKNDKYYSYKNLNKIYKERITMKVLFICDLAGYTAKLARLMLERGDDATLLLMDYTLSAKVQEDYLKKINLTEGLKYTTAEKEGIFNRKTLTDYIVRNKFDLVNSILTFSTLRASFLSKVPWSMHFHGTKLREDIFLPRVKLLRRFYFWKKRNFYTVSTIDLLDYLKKRSYWIPQPIDTEFWSPMDRDPETKTIFFPHRFDDTKGVEIIFKAWKELEENGFSLKIFKWGGRWEEFREMFGDENVTYLDYMSKEELRNLINQTAIMWGSFVLNQPSQMDLEILSSGRRLIGASTSYKSYNYEVPKTTCNNSEELVQLTKKFSDETETLEENRTFVINHHGFDAIYKKTKEIFEKYM